MSGLQENRVSEIKELIKELGLRHTPQALGLSEETVTQSFISAQSYAIEDKMAFSILNERDISPELAAKLIAGASE